MSVTVIVGLVLIVLGFAFIVRGLKGVFTVSADQAVAPSWVDPVSKLIDNITKLIAELAKAPTWLAATVIGVVLILLGLWIGGWL